jgi:hypothetical protein
MQHFLSTLTTQSLPNKSKAFIDKFLLKSADFFKFEQNGSCLQQNTSKKNAPLFSRRAFVFDSFLNHHI